MNLNLSDIRVTGLTQPEDGSLWEVKVVAEEAGWYPQGYAMTTAISTITQEEGSHFKRRLCFCRLYRWDHYESDSDVERGFFWVKWPITEASAKRAFLDALRRNNIIPYPSEVKND